MNAPAVEPAASGEPPPSRRPAASRAGRIGLPALSIVCFAYLYVRLNGAAAREGLSLVEYMARVFAGVEWVSWIVLMMAYSGFYFLIDTLVMTRALNWFVTRSGTATSCRFGRVPTSSRSSTNRSARSDGLLPPPAPSGAGVGSGIRDAVS